MRYHPSQVRSVSSLFERPGLRDTYSCLKDTCGDYDCTQGLVGEIVVAIKEATSACVGLKGIVSLSLAKPIAQVIIVSSSFLPLRPRRDPLTTNSVIVGRLRQVERSPDFLQGPVRRRFRLRPDRRLLRCLVGPTRDLRLRNHRSGRYSVRSCSFLSPHPPW